MATTVNPSTTIPISGPTLYDDRSSQVVGASIVLIVLPTIAVLLRLLSRWISRAGFWWDDAVVILAMIFAWGPNIVNLVSVHHGLGKHVYSQPEPLEILLIQSKILYSFEFLYILAINTIKYSILLFLYRIFPIAQFRRILKFALAYVISFSTTCVLVTIFQCVPIHDFWDTLGGRFSPRDGGRCINVKFYFLIAGAINTVTDFALLALPIPILWRLKTGRPQKLLLTGIFTMGLVYAESLSLENYIHL